MHVASHLGLEEIRARYHEAKAGRTKVHWQVIRMAAEGQTASEIAKAVDYTVVWVFQVVSRYNQDGPKALGDLRRNNKGRSPLLSPDQVEALRAALNEPAPDGGLWNSTKVATWMSERLGRPVSVQRAWDYMVRSGFSLQRPRPRHADSDPEAQEEFKKKLYRPHWKPSGRATPTRRSNSGPKTSTVSD